MCIRDSLNALAGKGVHVVTVNDYLSKRDSEWMGPLYMFHGLSVDLSLIHILLVTQMSIPSLSMSSSSARKELMTSTTSDRLCRRQIPEILARLNNCPVEVS